MIALLFSVLAAAPVEGRFVLEVSGLPVAELRISARGARYVYEATHFLEEGPRERRVELELKKDGPLPEVLALLRRPSLGCRDVLEERTQVLEQLCVERSDPSGVSGTLDGAAFLAQYDGEGRLTAISVGAARWSAVHQPTAPPAQSPFVQGVKVPPGPLVLDPPVPGARWLTQTPLAVGKPDRVGRVRCLLLAREEAARRPEARVAVGLVIDSGRAYPHAWVSAGGSAYEPSVLEGDPVLSQRRYLEIPVEQSGAFFLRLFDGAVRLKAK